MTRRYTLNSCRGESRERSYSNLCSRIPIGETNSQTDKHIWLRDVIYAKTSVIGENLYWVYFGDSQKLYLNLIPFGPYVGIPVFVLQITLETFKSGSVCIGIVDLIGEADLIGDVDSIGIADLIGCDTAVLPVADKHSVIVVVISIMLYTLCTCRDNEWRIFFSTLDSLFKDILFGDNSNYLYVETRLIHKEKTL